MAMALKEGNTAMPIGDIGEGEGLEAVSYSQVFKGSTNILLVVAFWQTSCSSQFHNIITWLVYTYTCSCAHLHAENTGYKLWYICSTHNMHNVPLHVCIRTCTMHMYIHIYA